MAVLLEVKNLKTQFKTETGLVKAVDGVSYHADELEIVGLVGESGCGKSVSQLSTMQLIPNPPGKITNGEIRFGKITLSHGTVKNPGEYTRIFGREPLFKNNHCCPIEMG